MHYIFTANSMGQSSYKTVWQAPQAHVQCGTVGNGHSRQLIPY